MFSAHTQVICTIFGFKIYFYGVILALAILVGSFVADYAGVKYCSLKKETLIDLAPWLVISGVIGARLYYCILNYDFYLRFPTEVIAIRHGGISIHGAILGGLLGLIIYAKRKNLSVVKLCDASVLGLALAQSVGRWGNFFNSEAFGLPTNLPWKLYIAPQYRPIPYTDYEYFHPTFLYESILDFFIFLILLEIFQRSWNKREGNITLYYLILYSCARILVEFLRIDSVRYVCGIPVAIFVSIGIIFISILIFISRNLYKKV
jgi:phosphatidylglycerol:prolipoprotein diacylglycerol transferase